MDNGTYASRVVWILTISTALALFGDTTMYAVLPSQYSVLGLLSLHVGWLLSINRLVRLPLNIVSGWLSDRLGPKLPYILGVALGAFSTVGYGLCNSFWPFMALRALWGVAWALLVVAAFRMILDVTTEQTRGRLTGFYASGSFFGGALGAILGGYLVDLLGFYVAMLLLGAMSSLGFMIALALPQPQPSTPHAYPGEAQAAGLNMRLESWLASLRQLDLRMLAISSLNFSHRFFFAGVFYATFGLYLRNNIGEQMNLGSLIIGIGSLTAVLLFIRNVLTVITAPGLGYLSDRLADRSLVVLLGEILGAAGLGCFALGTSPGLLAAGVLFTATAYGIIPPLVVSWMGDLSRAEGRGLVVGIYQTMGDIGSGLGPLAAYGVLELMDIRLVYAISAAFMALTIPVILGLRRNRGVGTFQHVSGETKGGL